MERFHIGTKVGLFISQILILLAVIFSAGIFMLANLPEIFISQGSAHPLDVDISMFKHSNMRHLSTNNMVIYDTHEDIRLQRDDFIAKQKDFLFADLHAMTIMAYEKGQVIKTFPILQKAKSGTFFEIPNASYAVQSKEQKHTSFMQDAILPWAIAFGDNYSIHGIPMNTMSVYQDTISSGSGLQLATQDAKELFAFARIEMPLLVLAQEKQQQKNAHYFKKILPINSGKKTFDTISGISAVSALAADVQTGEVLFEKQQDTIRPIASVTKLMTALVAMEIIGPFKRLVVNEEAVNTSGDTGKLRLGDVLTAKDLLYPLLLASSNDAAMVYATHTHNFMQQMNAKAQEIGLAHTIYEDPTGLTSKNVSTASDLLKLLLYMYHNQKDIFTISSLPEYAVAPDNKLYAWKNNTWPDNNGIFLGGKFGFIPEARQTLAAVFGIHVSEYRARPIAIILLGSHDRRRDVALIIDYIRKHIAYGSTLITHIQGPTHPDMRIGAFMFDALSK